MSKCHASRNEPNQTNPHTKSQLHRVNEMPTMIPPNRAVRSKPRSIRTAIPTQNTQVKATNFVKMNMSPPDQHKFSCVNFYGRVYISRCKLNPEPDSFFGRNG